MSALTDAREAANAALVEMHVTQWAVAGARDALEVAQRKCAAAEEAAIKATHAALMLEHDA